MQLSSADGSGSLHEAASDGSALGSQAAPVPSVEWEYEGTREELHGVQRALVGAIVTDDVFGAAILQGEASGEPVWAVAWVPWVWQQLWACSPVPVCPQQAC